MHIRYTISFLLLLVAGIQLSAQENLQTAPPSGRYQQIDLSTETPCACDKKPARYQELYKSVTETDMRSNRMYAYRFGFNSPVHGASKLFRALEEDPGVMKISVREWDYMLIFATKDFDKASFEAAAAQVLADFSEVTPADYFLYKNASLYQTFQQVYPQGYSVPSSVK